MRLADTFEKKQERHTPAVLPWPVQLFVLCKKYVAKNIPV